MNVIYPKTDKSNIGHVGVINRYGSSVTLFYGQQCKP